MDMKEFREQRDLRLQWSDWTQLPDVNLSEEQKEQWRVWRNQLRSLPTILSENSSYTFIWPPSPDGSEIGQQIINKNSITGIV